MTKSLTGNTTTNLATKGNPVLNSQISAQSLRGSSFAQGDEVANLHQAQRKLDEISAEMDSRQNIGNFAGRTLRGIFDYFFGAKEQAPSKATSWQDLVDRVALENLHGNVTSITGATHNKGVCYTLPNINPNRTELRQIIARESANLASNPNDESALYERGKAALDYYFVSASQRLSSVAFKSHDRLAPNLDHTSVDREVEMTRQSIKNATDDFERAIALGSKDYRVHFNLGLIDFHRNRFDAAFAHFKDAIDAAPAGTALLNYFAGIACKDAKKKEEYLVKEQGLNPSPSLQSEIDQQFGFIHYRLYERRHKKNPDLAEIHLKKAQEFFERSASNPMVRAHLAEIADKQGDHQKALSYLLDEIESNEGKTILNYKRSPIYLHAGNIYMKLNQTAEALAMFEKLPVSHASRWESLAEVYAKTSSHQQAQESLLRAISIRERNEAELYRPYHLLAQSRLAQKGFETSVADIEEFMQKNSVNKGLLMQRASLYFEQSKTVAVGSEERAILQTKALEDLESAKRMAPSVAMHSEVIGMIYQDMGNSQEAEKYRKEASQIRKGNKVSPKKASDIPSPSVASQGQTKALLTSALEKTRV
jgi:tetratricopeptide (TPR) repeat protein